MRICVLLLCLAPTLLAESAACVKWTAPAGWKSEGQRPMRAATYTIAPAAGDQDAAECAVYFFGAGQGGSVEANIDRWKGQFRQAGAVQPRTRTIHGLPVTTIDISGEYSGMGQTAKSGYRLLGAIVEAPGGNLFFKFTGPAKTIAANQPKFEQLLTSLAKE